MHPAMRKVIINSIKAGKKTPVEEPSVDNSDYSSSEMSIERFVKLKER